MKKIYLLFSTLVVALNLSAQQTLYFPPTTGNAWETISPQSLGYCQARIDSLYAFLAASNTRAFILLQDGRIVLEQYFQGHTPSTPWPWASAGKTITAFVVGIAQQEGHLSILDSTATYLGPGWTNCSPAQEEKIRIIHQLSMTSGLDDGVPDHFCTLDTCLSYKADAGTRWAYHNGPYTLLDQVLEAATGQTLNAYTTQKLKIPTGMTGAFVPVGYNNVYFSNARSMARFGLLMLNQGNWNGNPIMSDQAYFQQMVNISQQLNKSYGYLWWLNGKQSYMLPGTQFVFPGFLNPNAPADMYVGMGKDGQFLNVVPSQNRVWIRMGEAPDNLPVPFLLNDQIWAYVNNLPCAPSGSTQADEPEAEVQVFPNPSSDFIRLCSAQIMEKVEVFDVRGQLVKSENTPATEINISASDLPGGTYIIRFRLINGRVGTKKWIKL